MLQKIISLTSNKEQLFTQAKEWTQGNWIKIFSLFLVAYVLLHKDLNFQLNLNGTHSPVAYQAMAMPFGEAISTSFTAAGNYQKERSSSDFQKREHPPISKKSKKSKKRNTPILQDDNLANTYSNMTYSPEGYISKKSKSKKWKSKRKKQEAYVRRFSKIAKEEMEKYGIPASITLAQGLIETNAGDSRLAKKNNNHFGMKCFSRRCRKGHCSNFTDDTHKDFFRKYKSSWESYRAHSQLLVGKRYRHLKKLGRKDYKGWAKGLKKAGYATDPRYAKKLISIIDELKLYQFDNE